MAEILRKLARRKAMREGFDALVQQAQQQGIEPTPVGNAIGYALPLDNVSYRDDAGVANGSLNQ